MSNAYLLRSMTGFGRALWEDENWSQTWEVRSVNGRHLDIRWKLPSEARVFEGMLEKLVKQYAARGRVEISLNLQARRPDQALHFNEAAADAILERLSAYAAMRGDSFTLDYNRLIGISRLWEEGQDEADDPMMQTLGQSLEQGLILALNDWNESRMSEARALEKDLLMRILRMEEWTDRIKERAPDIKEERFETVRERVGEVLARHCQDIEDIRFLQEITLLADRLDVSEELTRLAIHLERLRELLASGIDAGRKLDFTMQECFREITTCGNKIQDVQISRLVVDLKNELEKCREQVQNIE